MDDHRDDDDPNANESLEVDETATKDEEIVSYNEKGDEANPPDITTELQLPRQYNQANR